MAEQAPKAPPGSEHSRLDQLVRQYGGLIRRVVARTAGRDASAIRDDIEQQVLVNIWRQLDREQTIDYPASYLYRVAVRETVRVVRRERAREQPAGDAADLAPRAVTASTPESELQ